jgi:hypothetical protein
VTYLFSGYRFARRQDHPSGAFLLRASVALFKKKMLVCLSEGVYIPSRYVSVTNETHEEADADLGLNNRRRTHDRPP